MRFWRSDYVAPAGAPYARLVRPIYRALCGGDTPPAELIAKPSGEYEDAGFELQTWCLNHQAPGLEWMTGLSVLEAVDLIVAGALENDNIRSPDDERNPQ